MFLCLFLLVLDVGPFHGVQYPGDVGGQRGFGVSRIDLGGPWVDLGDLGG